jgi:acyl carrier protein
MTRDEIRTAVVAELSNIAPDTDPGAVDPDADLREALDIDSMDFLNFIMAVHKRLGVDVPERDYPKLVTLSGAVLYLEQRMPTRRTGA